MGSAFGAGAGADMLQQVLRQKFEEAIRNQQLQQQGVRDQAALRHYGAMEQEATAQTDMQRKRLEAELAPQPVAPPKPPAVHIVGGRLIDDNGNVKYEPPATPEKPAPKRGPMSVAPGGYVFDPETGKQVYHAPDRPEKAGQAQPLAPQQQNDIADTLTLIDQIKNDPSRATSTGPLDSRGLGMLTDTTGVTRVNALHNQLVGKMSLAQAGKLKGQGQISDKERALLRDAATALTQHMGDADYVKELDKVRAQFERMAAGGAAQPAAAKGGFTVVEIK